MNIMGWEYLKWCIYDAWIGKWDDGDDDDDDDENRWKQWKQQKQWMDEHYLVFRMGWRDDGMMGWKMARRLEGLRMKKELGTALCLLYIKCYYLLI